MKRAGGFVFDEKPFTAIAANITPDKETGIGKWTDAQIITAIREGSVRTEPSSVRPWPSPFSGTCTTGTQKRLWPT